MSSRPPQPLQLTPPMWTSVSSAQTRATKPALSASIPLIPTSAAAPPDMWMPVAARASRAVTSSASLPYLVSALSISVLLRGRSRCVMATDL